MNKKEIREMRKAEEARGAVLAKKAAMVKWIAIGVIATVFIGFFLFLVVSLRNNNPNFSSGDGTVVLSDSGQYRVASGSSTPAEVRPIIITEFADLQCPHCKTAHYNIKPLLDLYPEVVALQYKHFPLTFHNNAIPAALAAEAAGKQGKFFEMVDLLYENQETWTPMADPNEAFVGYAQEIGLDINQFTADLSDESLRASIDAQSSEGTNVGVAGTPAFFLNGVRIETPGSIAAWQTVVDAALAEVNPATSSAPEEEASPSAAVTGVPAIDL